MKVLLAHGADVNAIDQYGQTALFMTAYFGDTAGTEFLLQHGANIHTNAGKTTVLMVALGNQLIGEPKQKTEQDVYKTVRCLLSHGAKVGGKDANGRTVLTLAEEDWRYGAVARLLKQAGAK